MPQIVRAEFLSYYNSARNSDKLFNVFVVADDDGSFRCVTEYGRRGNNLIRDTLCSKSSRETAESKLRQKLSAKRNHRETPYTDEAFGYNYSQFAREHNFNPARRNENAVSTRAVQPPPAVDAVPPKSNVVEFPVNKEKPREIPQTQTGILNQDQLNSLEL